MITQYFEPETHRLLGFKIPTYHPQSRKLIRKDQNYFSFSCLPQVSPVHASPAVLFYFPSSTNMTGFGSIFSNSLSQLTHHNRSSIVLFIPPPPTHTQTHMQMQANTSLFSLYPPLHTHIGLWLHLFQCSPPLPLRPLLPLHT